MTAHTNKTHSRRRIPKDHRKSHPHPRQPVEHTHPNKFRIPKLWRKSLLLIVSHYFTLANCSLGFRFDCVRLLANRKLTRTCSIFVFVCFIFSFVRRKIDFPSKPWRENKTYSNLRSFKEECSPLLAVVIIPSSAFVAAVFLAVNAVGGVLLRLNNNSRQKHCTLAALFFFLIFG